MMVVLVPKMRMIIVLVSTRMRMVVLVPTMHKEAPTLTDAARTKSDGSASLVVFSSDKFSILETIQSFLPTTRILHK